MEVQALPKLQLNVRQMSMRTMRPLLVHSHALKFPIHSYQERRLKHLRNALRMNTLTMKQLPEL